MNLLQQRQNRRSSSDSHFRDGSSRRKMMRRSSGSNRTVEAIFIVQLCRNKRDGTIGQGPEKPIGEILSRLNDLERPHSELLERIRRTTAALRLNIRELRRHAKLGQLRWLTR